MGRRSGRKEKGISLSIFYLKYFLYVFIASAIICIAALLALDGLIDNNIIYRADYVQEQTKEAQKAIENAASVTADMIPELCRYAIFDLDGNRTAGNLEENKTQTAWEAVSGKAVNYGGDVYRVIGRRDGYCVLKYRIVPQYRSEILRKYLLPPQTLILISMLLMILISVVMIAIRFGCVLKKKMHPLVAVTEKIKMQDLDFSIEKGDIKEINSILEAMDRMRRELKNSLESQWRAEQRRKEQISALAHDLKTPLTIIRGNAELLYDTGLTEEQAECADYIEESSLQMQNYIRMLIDIARDTELYRPQLCMMNVIEFAEGLHKTAGGLCCSKNISLKWELKSGIKQFSVDAGLLERAWNNVLSNAVEYTPEGGIIEAEIYDENGFLVFTIADSGSGFSGEALKYAAAQFYMDSTGRNSKLHYGIGLYFTDMVVKQHGGTLILENKSGSTGAKVTIRIPVRG